jgi:ABC-type Fe3+/spermidine/putrescine transport system ATPase subunit
VAGVAGNQIQIDLKGINRVTVPYSGAAAGDIAVAVRPEKVLLDRAEPASHRIRLRGRVSEVAYFGNESHIYLENATGVPVSVNLKNATRTTTPNVAIGDELWMSWDPSDTLVLTE